VKKYLSGISANCLFFFLRQEGGKEYFAVLTASPLAESVKMESYCSVKIRAKTLTECSWFKSALINPSSMIENWWCKVVKVTIQNKADGGYSFRG